MPRKLNRIIAEDLGEDEDILAALDAEDERDEEVDETEVLDVDDMYDIDSEEREEASRKPKPSKGKGTKAATKSHKDDEWRPANTLDAPPPRPGMVQRWVRHLSPGSGEEADAKNWSRSMREGWKPRAVNTVPNGFDAPTARHGSLGTIITVGDLVLCEMPRDRFKSRQKYFREKRERALAAVQKRPLAQLDGEGGPRIVVENKRNVTFGRRRAQATDED